MSEIESVLWYTTILYCRFTYWKQKGKLDLILGCFFCVCVGWIVFYRYESFQYIVYPEGNVYICSNKYLVCKLLLEHIYIHQDD